MGVSSKGERYLCEICGNEVVVEKVGGGTLVCCGQDMTLIDEK
jgi:desulfoferrodoxin-like iron-binding protein